MLDQYQLSIEDFTKVIHLKSDYADAYSHRGVLYFIQGKDNPGYNDAQKACALGNCELLEWARSKKDNAVDVVGSLKLIIGGNPHFGTLSKAEDK